jgi:hypothetical protein
VLMILFYFALACIFLLFFCFVFVLLKSLACGVWRGLFNNGG